jgi:hypothetical protein
MSVLFEKYKSYLLSKETYDEQCKLGTIDSRDYISISAVNCMKKHYITIADFNKFLNELFKLKIESNNIKTDQNLTINIQNCYNLMYVDVDYYYDLEDNENIDDVNQFNSTMAHLITNAIKQAYKDSKYLTFIPVELVETNKLVKGGVHIYVFTNEVITDTKNKHNIILSALKSNSQYRDYFNEYNHKLRTSTDSLHNLTTFIDPQPLRQCGGGMPFAQKSQTSRNYILLEHNIDTKINYNYIKRCEIINEMSYKKIYDSESDSLNYAEMSTLSRKLMRKMIINDAANTLYDEFDIREPLRSNLRKIDAFLYDFIDGLSSMDSNHYFLKHVFNYWELRRKFEYKFVNFYYALMVIAVGSKLPENTEYMSKRIAQLFAPLYIRFNKLHSDEKQQTISWIFTETKIKSIIHDYKEFGTMYKEFTEKRKSNKKKDEDEIDEDTNNAIIRIQTNIKYAILDWATYVIKKILLNIRYEIQPFTRLNRNRINNPATFKDVMPIVNQCGLDFDLNNIPKSEYIAQIRNLNKMFIFCLVVERSVNQITNIVGDIIRAYTKAYILSKQDDKSTNKYEDSIYIYNIHQTEELHKYPYNQWILDDERNLQNWTFVLYKNMFEPLLNTGASEKIGGLALPLKLLEYTQIIDKITPGKLITSLKSPFEYNRFSKTLVQNILGTYKSELHENPKPEDPEESKYFALRNGILEWRQEGSKYVPIFSSNNRNIILGSYTLIKWNDPKTYNKNCREYKDMVKIIEQIYPIKEEREYMLDLFSTIICPFIKKDQILVVYGTGGDGKSTMDDILTSMLGVTSKMCKNYIERGNKIPLSVPFGYAGNVDASTFTHIKQQGNGHDEGGKINMAHKTFCVCQEPQQGKNLVTSTIKDLTSGAISHGRKINQAEQMFKNNALIVMETNRVLQYDKVDDAVKRRMIVYDHKSKFTTEVNDNQLKDVKFKFKADQDLINRAKTHTEYWDALFQILLEHAVNLLNKGIKVVSDIRKPESVEQFTRYSFDNSSPLLHYLYDNYEQDENSFMFVTDIVAQIKEHDKTCDTDEKIITAKQNINSLILSELQDKYSGKFYKINHKIITKGNKWKLLMEEDCKSKTIQDILEKYSDGKGALTDIINNNSKQYKDIILVGYRLKINDDTD